MINPERLIGGLLNGALEGNFGKKKKKKHRSSSLGGLLGNNKTAIGMGLMGLAFAAFEHFQKNQGTSGMGGFGFGGNPASTPPPPPPGARPTAPPPPPPGASPAESQEQEALLILRAMIAAANADYQIDQEERDGIIDKAREAGLSEEELELIAGELEHPVGLTDVVKAVQNPQQAEEVYVASLLAIDVDTEAEKNYLRALRDRLKLAPEVVQKWHTQLDLPLEA